MVSVLLLSFGAQFSLAWGGRISRLGVTTPKSPPRRRAFMDVFLGNLLHWFYGLDVV